MKVLGSFKTAYFDYKAKAALECPSNPWRVQNNAIFARIDAFLERCHDVLELTTTIAQFQKVGIERPRKGARARGRAGISIFSRIGLTPQFDGNAESKRGGA